MKKLVSVLVAAFSCCAAAAAPAQPVSAGCPGVDYLDQDETILRLRAMYREERFAELDAILGCLMRDDRDFSTGKPAVAAVYQVFRRQMPAPGVALEEIGRVQRWAQQQQPPSVFAEFAALRLRYSFAWNARGGAVASKVSDGGWTSFRDGLGETEKALGRASAELRGTPIWHQLLLAVAGDGPDVDADMNAVFESAVKRWPRHYDFHEVRLTRLVPRWGGSWQQVDAFIRHWSTQQQGPESDAVYARLYASFLVPMKTDPRETLLQWPRMKRGLEALVARYPDPTHRNLAASFACAYQDAAFFQASLQRIPQDQLRPAAWLRGTDPHSCTR